MQHAVANIIRVICLFTLVHSGVCVAHGSAQYLGNSAVLVTSKQHKILFDPFFHNDFGIYQLVPDELRNRIMQGKAPYDSIDAIFISHAHEDHFSASDVATYLQRSPQTYLVAPQQALDMLADYKIPAQQLVGFSLQFGGPAQQKQVNELVIEAVRIPHAGWPARKEIENMVFRVKLGDTLTAMHMGDADPDDDHYLPYTGHWQKQQTDINFPPYWFFMSAEGRDILHDILNAKQHIGIHVPRKTPKYLKESGHRYFSLPGEKITIEQ